MEESEQGAGAPTNIKDLKPNMEGVTVEGRVLEASPPRVIETKKGRRTISNAIIGDGTGRVETTLWGEKAGTLKEGQVVRISGAWTTTFRGKVQLNVGKSSNVEVLPDDRAPRAEEIPEETPAAPEGAGPAAGRGPPRRFGRGRRYER
ncbi:MAG: OB-fold nucleic acid binding domain-containing protein [Desulfurococcaceae archaeon]